MRPQHSLKCVLVYKRVHGIASFYLLSELRHAHQVYGYNTKSRDLLLSGLFRKQLSAKEASEKNVLAHTTLNPETFKIIKLKKTPSWTIIPVHVALKI